MRLDIKNSQSPVGIIVQAREKARKELLSSCGDEIRRICNDFSQYTGLAVKSISFDLIDVTAFGDDGPSMIVGGPPDIHHEDV